MRTPVVSRAARKSSGAVELWTSTVRSEIGSIVIVTNSGGLCALEFGDCEERMKAFLSRRFGTFVLHRGDHLGVDGPCTYEDGRGTCSCSSFAEMTIETEPVTAAAGDMVWAPEDGIGDLLDDINEQLELYDGEFCAKDITLGLDRVLIKCEDDDSTK
jgi:hypothetical protein